MKKRFIIIPFSLLIVILPILATLLLNRPLYNGLQQHFEVRAKESPLSISQRLQQEKLIRSKRLLYYYAKVLLYRGFKIQKGKYLLSDSMSPYEILEKMIYGRAIEEKIVLTIPEGYNIFDIAKLLVETKIIKEEQDFLKLTKDKALLSEYNITSDTIEGYLYPTTYYVAKDNKIITLVKRMLNTFKANFPETLFNKASKRLGLKKHDIITLASLIEKETSIENERKIVSGVYHNRLKKDMRLECDPTVIYALLRENRYKGKLSRKRGDLDIKSPYNTYLYKNLPPSPIANPGTQSMLAAMEPEDNDFIFFVAKNDKSHLFSKTWQGHLDNIKLYKEWLIAQKRRRK